MISEILSKTIPYVNEYSNLGALFSHRISSRPYRRDCMFLERSPSCGTPASRPQTVCQSQIPSAGSCRPHVCGFYKHGCYFLFAFECPVDPTPHDAKGWQWAGAVGHSLSRRHLTPGIRHLVFVVPHQTIAASDASHCNTTSPHHDADSRARFVGDTGGDADI